jgi:predicted phosphate transport protein (TIGR00153 family)
MRFRLRLTPQNKEFFRLYGSAARNSVEMARQLVELLDRFPEDGAETVKRIKDLEHQGDRLTHDIVDLLNRTFVTPFDRDDMYRLASALDDIADHVDEAADNIGLYGVKVIPDEAKAQAQVILRSAMKLDEAVALLDGFKDVRPQLIELRSLEDEGDRIERDAIAGLFRSGQDAVSILRWKDLHEQLEAAVDACEYAADVLEAIVVKNR